MTESTIPIPYKNKECKILSSRMMGVDGGVEFCLRLDQCLTLCEANVPAEINELVRKYVEEFVAQLDKYQDDKTLYHFLTALEVLFGIVHSPKKPQARRGRPRVMQSSRIKTAAGLYLLERMAAKSKGKSCEVVTGSIILSYLDEYLRNPTPYAEEYAARDMYAEQQQELQALGFQTLEHFLRVLRSSTDWLEQLSTEPQLLKRGQEIINQYEVRKEQELNLLKRKTLSKKVELFYERHHNDFENFPYRSADVLRSAYYREPGHMTAPSKSRRARGLQTKECP